MSRLSWPSRRESEEGFTLVEMLVALGVIFSTLLVLAFSMFSSFAAVGFSRQRTQASALANQTIEQIRALPFSMLYMSATDLASTSDIQVKSCASPATGYCFLTTSGRKIPSATFGSGTATTPFFPAHVTTPPAGNPGNTAYIIKSYVTIDPTDTSGQTKIATVQVSWSPAQVGGVLPNVQVESKIYTSPFSESAPGATTTTTAAPVHSYTANAQSQAGTITISGTVLNLSAVNVQFSLPAAKSYLSGSSTAGTSVGPTGNVVTGGTASSGISAAGFSLVSTPSAVATATSPAGSATNGPNSATQNPSLLGTVSGSLTQGLNVLGSTLTAGVAVGQVSTASALAASTATGSTNIPSGVIPNNSLGYGRATAVQTGALSSNLGLTVLGLSALNLGLVNLVPTGNSTPDMSTTNQNGSAGVPVGQTFNASTSKSFTELDVLTGLPVVGTLIKLTGFTAAASACAAPTPSNCAAATATQGGTLSIAGLANINLATAAVGTIGVPAVNVTTGILNVGVTASVTIGASTATGTSSASVTSPVAVNVHLLISTLVGTVVDLNVVVNLGTVTTSASYS